MAREYDEYQKAAINAMKNSVVSAGAGSGKTSVLSERFSHLIIEKNLNVDEILTLTFTKKATVEMSDRIYKTLKEKVPSQAANFYKANIKTLDSYCNTVAKLGCNFYGIAPDFSMDDETVSSKVKAMALPFILQHRDNETIKALVKTSGFDEIAESLFATPVLQNSTVATPIDFDEKLKKQISVVVEEWNKTVAKINKCFSEMINIFNHYDGKNFTGARYLEYQSLFSWDNAGKLPEPLEISEGDIVNYPQGKIDDYYKALPQKINLPGNTGGFDGMKEAINSYREYFEDITGLFNFIYGYQYVVKLLPLMKEFQEKANDFKRSSGILSFKDVSDLALCILRDHPEIRKIEKSKYKAIMIDEFQDNNSKQRDMLFLLAENPERMEKGVPAVDELCKEKLFFVGDEKQSIYRFRGADVSVFRALSKDFKDGNLSMTTNYRSHQALIAGFNTIFGGAVYPGNLWQAWRDTEKKSKFKNSESASVFFTAEDEKYSEAEKKDYEIFGELQHPVFYADIIPDYEPVYHSVTLPKFREEEDEAAFGKPRYKEIYAPRIHIAEYEKTPDEEDFEIIEEEAEAVWVAKKILELTAPDENGKQKYTVSDIAILFRNYSLQHIYERTFLNYGIPYVTETTTGLFSDGPTNDIFSYLRLCAYPEDTLAFAELLRSPWLNFSVSEMNEILKFNAKNEKLPFEQENFEFLSESSSIRYKNAKEFFDAFKISSKTESLCELITKLWYDSGYRYETMWNETSSMYSRMYDLMFELARKAEEKNMSLAAFVDSVRKYSDMEAKLEGLDIPMEQKNGVHIMTIHKSKGLEFPVVFVCATHKVSKYEQNVLPVYSCSEYGITVNTPISPLCSTDKKTLNYFFNKVKEQNKQEEYAELKRVTYVALTRAKEQLYITRSKDGNNIPSSIAKILEPVIEHFKYAEDCELSPFDFETIPPVNRDFTLSSDKRKNNSEAKLKLLSDIEKSGLYEKVNVLEEEKLSRIYVNPSQLHAADDETYGKDGSIAKTDENGNAFPTEKSAFPEYDKINDIISSTIPKYDVSSVENPEPAFSYAHFGTIAHAHLEAKINGEKPKVSNRDIIGLENKKKSLETVLEICRKMADSFEQTELGKEAVNSKWHKAEYDFRSRIFYGENNSEIGGQKSKIIKGTIDLVFENSSESPYRYTVVDYKTNQTVNPEIYYNQLSCYRQAVSQMLNVKPEEIRCCLHYLRFNKTVDITEAVSGVDLAKAMEEL